MTGWIVQTLVASALLMMIVLMLRAPVARGFGARAAYALWLLPVLRMVLPPLPGWRTLGIPVLFLGHGPHQVVGIVDPATAARLASEAAPAAAAVTHGALPVEALPPLPVQMVVAPHPVGPGWGELVVLLWLGVAALWFGWQMIRYRLFLARAMKSARLLTRECGIDVLISAHVDGPVAAGIVKRRIFLPADFMQRYAPMERRLALVHEAAHHDRRDIIANLVGLAVLALHWWNPFAHRAYRAFRADQELACDATVLADAGEGDRLAYGHAVIKSVSARMPGVACALSHKAELKQRIRMMATKPMGATRLLIGGMVAVSAIGGGLLLTASGSAAAADAVHPVTFTGPAPAEVEAARIEADRAERHAEKAGRKAEAHAAMVRAKAREARLHAEVLARRAEREGEMAARAGEELSREADRHAAFVERQVAIAERNAARAGADAAVMTRTALTSARAGLVGQCRAAGTPVRADADWGALATCGRLREMVRTSLDHARVAIASSRGMSDADRARAMADIDRAATEADREIASQPDS